MTTKAKQIIGLVILTVATLVVYKCFLSPGAQVDRTIKQAKDAIENGDVDGCLKYVSRQYHDSFGHDYKSLKTALTDFLKGPEQTKIFIIRKKKKFLLNQCEATIQMLINTSSAEFGPVRGQEFIRVTLTREPDKVWRGIKADILEQNPFAPGSLPGQKEVL